MSNGAHHGGWVVVTVSSDACQDNPQARCPGQAFGTFDTRVEAETWAREHVPLGLLPHFLLLDPRDLG